MTRIKNEIEKKISIGNLIFKSEIRTPNSDVKFAHD